MASLFYFAANATVAPVLPRFVKEELGRGNTVVGAVVGAGAIGALLVRPSLGRLSARYGTRVLIVAGSLVGAVGFVGHIPAHSVMALVGLRMFMGMGQAASLVSATSMAMELSPPERRGEATAYVLVGSQVGLAMGPMLGEFVLNHSGYRMVWLTASLGMMSSMAAGLAIRGRFERVLDAAPSRAFHGAGLGPGLVIGVGHLGFIGFNAFVPLYGRELEMGGVAPVFLLLSLTVIAIRAFGGSLPDRLGPVRGAALALVLSAIGLVTVGATHTVLGLYLGAVGIGAGSALLFPALAAAATTNVSDRDRTAALATFTLFLDLTIGLAPVVNGAMASAFDYRTMFIAAAVYPLASLVMVFVVMARRLPGLERRAAIAT